MVLLLVHVAIAAHIVQWQITGSTLSPVEPSESMQTLEQGLVNAGFILFALSILSTAIFGRFFCGWACHVIALQDACTWMLGKVGLRPRPFRTRLLIFAPVVLALYMFAWPNVKRHLLFPALEALDVARPFWLKDVATITRFESELIVEDFWVTFPPWYVAIPFLFVCGFATVYFLGNKGFCTYACPYGGFFAPVERLSPVRIRVNDDCEHCGHCTAVCTSNVRVHEEVRDYGAVVDPGCMKCLDCVSACPNDALSLGIGLPAVLTKARNADSVRASRAKAKRRYDMTLRAEVLFALIFLALFLSYRGMLNGVPMLMAGGIGAIGVALIWKAWETLRTPNSRLHRFQLRRAGRLRPAGAAFLLLVALFLAGGAWGGTIRTNRFLSDLDYMRAEIPGAMAVRADFDTSDATRDAARRAAARYGRADAFGQGGFGWALDPDSLLRLAYFQTIAGDSRGAIETIERIVEVGRPLDELVNQYVQLLIADGRSPEDVKRALEHVLDRHPVLTGVRTRLATFAAGEGRTEDALALLDAAPLEDARAMV
ncbi:MAG: 4Fe-4S binding protein, partial [Phycisphaerales bacterium]|nr:4Fe-4S binding protein [Phycisphaerales bacterium]